MSEEEQKAYTGSTGKSLTIEEWRKFVLQRTALNDCDDYDDVASMCVTESVMACFIGSLLNKDDDLSDNELDRLTEQAGDAMKTFFERALKKSHLKCDKSAYVADRLETLARAIKTKRPRSRTKMFKLGMWLIRYIDSHADLPTSRKVLLKFIKTTKDENLDPISRGDIAEHISSYLLEDVCRDNEPLR